MRSGPRIFVLSALLAIACDRPVPAHPVSPAPKASAPGAPRKREPVVVAIVVDQLSAWVAATRFPELPEGGGIARLRREGTWVKNLRYPYAVTDTAPGHASLHTGVTPAESGIFGNEVPNAEGNRVSFLIDESTKLVTAEGVVSAPGASAARLRAPTVADKLRAARPDALVVSVSVKDRGAIMPAGKKPSHVLWFDSWQDQFVTSTAFAETFPRWAAAIGDVHAVAKARSSPWTLSDPAWVKAHAKVPDDAKGEGDFEKMGTVFPHPIGSGNAFRASPESDAMIFDLAWAAIDAEYRPDRPTLVLVSISSSDVIGHVFGPDSWEAWDQLYKLDRNLGAFLTKLEGRVGPARVLLAADHGNSSMPEARGDQAWCKKGTPPDPWDRPCEAGTRLGPNPIRDALKAEARKVLGDGRWIAGFADPYVYLASEARALPAAKRLELDRVVREVLAKTGAIAEVYDTRDLAKRCPAIVASARPMPNRALPGEDILTLVCRSFDPTSGAGDFYAVPKPGAFFDGELVPNRGTSHGTPYLHDRTVPMLVRAVGLVDAGAVVEDPVDFSAYAALGAAFVGLDPALPRDILASRTAPRSRSARMESSEAPAVQ